MKEILAKGIWIDILLKTLFTKNFPNTETFSALCFDFQYFLYTIWQTFHHRKSRNVKTGYADAKFNFVR